MELSIGVSAQQAGLDSTAKERTGHKENGRTCRRIGNNNSYECLCPPGFNGSNCTDAIPCWGTPCHNGGSCRNTEKWNVYQGSCPANSTGSNCEDLYPCWSNPCDNDGTCKRNETSFLTRVLARRNGLEQIAY